MWDISGNKHNERAIRQSRKLEEEGVASWNPASIVVDQYQTVIFARRESISYHYRSHCTFPSCLTSVRLQTKVHIPGITIRTTNACTGEWRISANRPRSPHATLPTSLWDINRLSWRRCVESELRCARSASCTGWRTLALFDFSWNTAADWEESYVDVVIDQSPIAC
jgi:hypothetical protein